MSALHKADIARRLNDYLSRRQPPKSFGSDDRRKAEQMAAYVSIITRFAPSGDRLDEWWGKMLESLSESSDTWAWPSEGDLVKASKAVSKVLKVASADGWAVDPLAVAEARIQNDEPIGDNWLWGKNALLLIARVGVDQIMRRRDRMADHLARTYGDDVAREALLGLQERHSAAVKAAESERHARHTDIPEVKVKSVRDLLGPGPQYASYRPGMEAAE
ncbi:hypothetical protein [Paracoccus sp. (in: a-proteobacteria)]|uniref:hypothetical protein n=1 Tax=Paracoccus sp. TaxID=267 RepID=UPI002899A814|nr:hypothetical protein [Paracoccus sp. (in: a-proteobacteria)]